MGARRGRGPDASRVRTRSPRARRPLFNHTHDRRALPDDCPARGEDTAHLDRSTLISRHVCSESPRIEGSGAAEDSARMGGGGAEEAEMKVKEERGEKKA